MLVRLGFENLGFDGSRRLTESFDGPVGCSPLFLSSFSSRWSKEGTKIHFRFDSLHSVAVSTRWAELIQNQFVSRQSRA